MRSMTDEGYGVSHPPLPQAEASKGSLRDTPLPTFADAKATFSRKGRRKSISAPSHPHSPTTAVASISTSAAGSTSATTCTSAIAGKFFPKTSR